MDRIEPPEQKPDAARAGGVDGSAAREPEQDYLLRKIDELKQLLAPNRRLPDVADNSGSPRERADRACAVAARSVLEREDMVRHAYDALAAEEARSESLKLQIEALRRDVAELSSQSVSQRVELEQSAAKLSALQLTRPVRWTQSLKNLKRRVSESGSGYDAMVAASGLFDRGYYLHQHPEAARGRLNPLAYFLKHGGRLKHNPHPFFDSAYYLEKNPDVAAGGHNPLLHFLLHGAAEGRNPHPLFDVEFYKDKYPDVSPSGLNPLTHFLTLGGRQARDVHPFFDTAYYIKKYPDIWNAGFIPILHFLEHGGKEGRNPNAAFHTSYYFSDYPDVKASGLNPLVHFVLHGIGRSTVPPAFDSKFHSDALEWYDAAAPKVSIVILNWNNALFTRACLDSIWRHTAGVKYEIVLVDNGSRPDDFWQLVSKPGKFRILRSQDNRFFSEGNNLGAEAARGEFLVFLNNDVTVSPNWLNALLQMFEQHPDCGAAGPKFVYPDGRLQEAGALVSPDGTVEQRGKFLDPQDPRFQDACVVDYCSAAALLMRKEIFERALGFEYKWEPAYYEDSDLCLKLTLLDLKVWYCPSSVVVHHEGTTSHSSRKELDLGGIPEINKVKFVERWGGYLRSGKTRRPNGVLFDHAIPAPPPARGGRKTLMLYTPYRLIPGGGERYLLTIAEAARHDFDVHLMVPQSTSRLRLLALARDLDLKLDDVRIVSADDAPALGSVDVFVCMGNELLPPIAPLGRRNIYQLQFPFPITHKEISQRWHLWERYERIVVNSEYTRGHVLRQMQAHPLPRLPVDVVHPPVPLMPGNPAEQLGKKRQMILGVGRFFSAGHCKRQDFMIKAFAKLSKQAPDAELHLVGAIHPEPESRGFYAECRKLAEGLPVVFHPNASIEQLQELYREASIYWHATGWGVDQKLHPERMEHFGISVIEAMSAGCIPVVYGTAGPAETVTHGVAGFQFKTEIELVQASLKILGGADTQAVLEMRRQALKRASEYTQAQFSQKWLDLITHQPAVRRD